MSCREFFIIPAYSTPGDEITVDHEHRGREHKCDLCGAVLFRSVPYLDGGHGHKHTVNEPRVSLFLRIQAFAAGEPGYEISLPVELCFECAPGVLAPYAEHIKALRVDPATLRLLGEDEPADAGDTAAPEAAQEPATV